MLTMDARVAAYALVELDAQVLMVRGRGSPDWWLPGGGIEVGEQSAEAAVREVREETGYDIAVERLLAVTDEHVAPEDRVSPGPLPLLLHQVWYAARVIGGDLRDEVDGTTEQTRWVSLHEVERLRCADTVRWLRALRG